MIVIAYQLLIKIAPSSDAAILVSVTIVCSICGHSTNARWGEELAAGFRARFHIVCRLSFNLNKKSEAAQLRRLWIFYLSLSTVRVCRSARGIAPFPQGSAAGSLRCRSAGKYAVVGSEADVQLELFPQQHRAPFHGIEQTGTLQKPLILHAAGSCTHVYGHSRYRMG